MVLWNFNLGKRKRFVEFVVKPFVCALRINVNFLLCMIYRNIFYVLFNTIVCINIV